MAAEAARAGAAVKEERRRRSERAVDFVVERGAVGDGERAGGEWRSGGVQRARWRARTAQRKRRQRGGQQHAEPVFGLRNGGFLRESSNTSV